MTLYFLFGLFILFLLGGIVCLVCSIKSSDQNDQNAHWPMPAFFLLFAMALGVCWLVTTFNIADRLDKIDKAAMQKK